MCGRYSNASFMVFAVVAMQKRQRWAKREARHGIVLSAISVTICPNKESRLKPLPQIFFFHKCQEKDCGSGFSREQFELTADFVGAASAANIYSAAAFCRS
jgi:hypothetical protein